MGGLSSGWVGGVRRQGLAILLAVALWGAAITAFGLVGNRLRLALVCLAIAGGADVISAVFRNAVQQLIDRRTTLRGRLSAFNIFVVAGGPRLGDLEGGVVASVFTPAISVVSGGLLVPRRGRVHRSRRASVRALARRRSALGKSCKVVD